MNEPEQYEQPVQIGVYNDGRPMYASAKHLAYQPPACHHHAPVQRTSGGAAKWIGIGVGGSVLLITVAVSAVAVAISAVALTVCLLVLRSVWRDVTKGR
ncbi:hypothetical protein HY68_12570 [Streptomyces sp. AcH 505]|uniref:hypothetical protein n=1 Tax=Streptomyces sp. AcH 505 TaxID=352211 RepID=UPI0005920DF8|nr:hypothetical protein HY68_12570 [Streptomyces sp. AcH 505]